MVSAENFESCFFISFESCSIVTVYFYELFERPIIFFTYNRSKGADSLQDRSQIKVLWLLWTWEAVFWVVIGVAVWHQLPSSAAVHYLPGLPHAEHEFTWISIVTKHDYCYRLAYDLNFCSNSKTVHTICLFLPTM